MYFTISLSEAIGLAFAILVASLLVLFWLLRTGTNVTRHRRDRGVTPAPTERWETCQDSGHTIVTDVTRASDGTVTAVTFESHDPRLGYRVTQSVSLADWHAWVRRHGLHRRA